MIFLFFYFFAWGGSGHLMRARMNCDPLCGDKPPGGRAAYAARGSGSATYIYLGEPVVTSCGQKCNEINDLPCRAIMGVKQPERLLERSISMEDIKVLLGELLDELRKTGKINKNVQSKKTKKSLTAVPSAVRETERQCILFTLRAKSGVVYQRRIHEAAWDQMVQAAKAAGLI